MKNIIICLIYFLSFNLYASHTIGLGAFIHSHIVEGVSKNEGIQGKLISNNNLNYSFNYLWGLNRFLRLKGQFSQKTFQFSDDEDVIINDEVIKANNYSIGIKVIFARWGALSFDQVHDLDTSYKIVNTNQVKIVDTEIDYLKITYHQLLYQMNSLIFALDIGHELNSGNSFLISRSANFATGLLKWNLHGWGVDLFMTKKSISKESEKQRFDHEENLTGLSLYFSL